MRSFLILLITFSVVIPVFAQDTVSKEHKKIALLVGINDYPDNTPHLKGTIQDVDRMDWVLRNRFYFETETLTNEKATKSAILERLKFHSKNCKPGDMLLFYFSGYGSVVPDKDGDEEDGLDEIICPYDFEAQWNEPLSDDLFGAFLMECKDIEVIMILDCSFCLPGVKSLEWNPDSRIKTTWPPQDSKLYKDILEEITQKKQEERSCLFIDKDILPNHIFLGASRGYEPAFDATLKGGKITMDHGVFTCCMSANAFQDTTYKALIGCTIVSCQRAKIPQSAVIRCSRDVLDKKIFEFLSH